MKNSKQLLLASLLIFTLPFLNSCPNTFLRKKESTNFQKFTEQIIQREKQNNLETKVKKNKILKDAPSYKGYSNGHCAGYAISVARDYFNKNIYFAPAWDAGYANRITRKISGNEEFKKLALENKISPGVIVGTFYSKSFYLNKRDMKGNKVKYTHLMVYAGIENGEPIFYHQFIDKTEKIKLSKLSTKHLNIQEVIDEK